MPNHIISEVEISGTKEKIAELVKKVGITTDVDYDFENKFDFNGIIEMPKELLNTVSPTKVLDTQEEIDAENERHRESWKNDQVAAISQDEAEYRRNKYGALNWYDWAYANWGTKWNAYEVHLIAHEEGKLVVKIETAWDTPRPIWDELYRQGFTVKAVVYGEMEGYETIGDDVESVFDVYQDVRVEYLG